MEALLAALQDSAFARYLRFSWAPYAAVSALHVIGIAMLFGASLPLALRLAGAYRGIALEHAARLTMPLAASGAALAIITGLMLFSVRASEYARLEIF